MGGKACRRIWAGRMVVTSKGLGLQAKQVWDPDEVTECLKKECPSPGYAKETQLVALCWGLSSVY